MTTKTVAQAPVLPVAGSPKHPPKEPRPFDPDSPMASPPVQGRIDADGPIERYRVASRRLCLVAKVLGWTAVVVGAGEIAAGIVVFTQWRREGAWWAGALALMLGMIATGIDADTQTGSRLPSYLLALGLVTFVVSVVTLTTLDGARWLDMKDMEACAASFDAVCPPSSCTCTAADDLWNKCFDLGGSGGVSDGDCESLEGSSSALLASSVALIILAIISAMLFALGLKCKYPCDGVRKEGEKASFDPPQVGDGSTKPPYTQETRDIERQKPDAYNQGMGYGSQAGPSRGGPEEQKQEAATGAPLWASTYVDRLAGGGNKKRRDYLAGDRTSSSLDEDHNVSQ